MTTAYRVHPAAELLPKLSEEQISALSEDIKKHGQLEPITVLSDGRILDGRHRFEACRLAGVEPIVQLWEHERDGTSPTAWVLSKNLHRRHLNESQLGVVAAKALKLYEVEAKERQKAAGGDRRSVSAPGRTALWWKDLGRGSWDSFNGSNRYAVRRGGRGGQTFFTSTPDRGAWKAGPFLTDANAKAACEAEEVRVAGSGAGPAPAATAAPKGRATEAAGAAMGVSGRTVQRAKRVIEEASPEEVQAVLDGKKTLKQIDKALRHRQQVAQIKVYQWPAGEYPVVVVDYPWKYRDALDGSDRIRGGLGYPPMEISDICKVPIPVPKTGPAVLFCWVTNNHLIEWDKFPVVAQSLWERYGLEAKQNRTWVKTTLDGEGVKMGGGYVWRGTTEHLVRFERGSPVFNKVTQHTHFEAPVGEHSEKPQRAYDDILALCPAGPYLEMFARDEERPGWVTSGAELPKPVEGTTAVEATAPVERSTPPPPPAPGAPQKKIKGLLRIRDEASA